MPIFTVRTPTGRVLQVNVPEGATEQDAFDYVMDNHPDPVMRPTEEPGFFKEAAGMFESGWERGKAAAANLLPDLSSDETKAREQFVADGFGETRDSVRNAETARYVADQTRKSEAAGIESSATAAGTKAIHEADGWLDTAGEIITNPRAVAMTTAQSLGMAAPVLVASAATGGVLLPIVAGMGSGALEYGSTINDTLAGAGVDMTNAAEVARAMDNPELMAEARDRAEKRGLVVGTFDAITAGLAGRLLAGAKPGLTSVGSRVVGEGAIQAGGGGVGEAGAQLATDGRITSKADILMEAAAEVPSGLVEGRGNFVDTRSRLRAEAQQRADADAARLGLRDRATSLIGEDRKRDGSIDLTGVDQSNLGDGTSKIELPRTVQEQVQSLREKAQADYTDLGAKHGATITSRERTPERNAQVGGKPNSQHLGGTAGDFVVPAANKAAFIADAQARGYQAIDEGDHIHVQLPRGAKPRVSIADLQQQAQARAAARAEDVAAGTVTEGAAKVDTLLDGARASRGVPLTTTERTAPTVAPVEPVAPVAPPVAPQTPSAATDIPALTEQKGEALRKAQDKTLPKEQRAIHRSEAQTIQKRIDAAQMAPITQAATAMLDTAAAQSVAPLTTTPTPITTPTATAQAPVMGSLNVQQQAPVDGAAPAPLAATPQAPAAPGIGQAPVAQAEAGQQAVTPGVAPVTAPAAPGTATAAPQQAPTGLSGGSAEAPAPGVDFKLSPTQGVQATPEQAYDIGIASGSLKVAPENVEIVQAAPVQQQLANRLGRVLGRRVVFFRVKDGSQAIGFAAGKSSIYINADRVGAGSGMSVRALIGHEFVHNLRREAPEVFKGLMTAAQSVINRDSPYYQKMHATYAPFYNARGTAQGDGQMQAAVDEESLADFVGDLLNDDKFWADLALEDKPFFTKLINQILAYLDNMMAKAQRLGADDVFAEASAMRAKAKEILATHINAVRAAETGVGPETPAMGEMRAITERGVDPQRQAAGARMKLGKHEDAKDVMIGDRSAAELLSDAMAEGNLALAHAYQAIILHDGDIDAATDGVETYAKQHSLPDDVETEMQAELWNIQADAPETSSTATPVGPSLLKPPPKREVEASKSLSPVQALGRLMLAMDNMEEKPSDKHRGDLHAALAAAKMTVREHGSAASEVRDRIPAAHSLLDEHHSAMREASLTTDTKGPTPFVPETDEAKDFARGAHPVFKQGGKLRTYLHGTASTNVTKFVPKQAKAVFGSTSGPFASDFAAGSLGWYDRNPGGRTMRVGGEKISDIIGDPEQTFSAKWHAASQLKANNGDIDEAIVNLRDYSMDSGLYLDPDLLAEVREQLTEWDNNEKADPGFIDVSTEVAADHKPAMTIYAFITNASHPFQFADNAHVEALLDAYEKAYPKGPGGVQDSMVNGAIAPMTWSEAKSRIKQGDWTLIEALVPELLASGYDSFMVTEQGETNIAVFDPRKIKSRYGNTGAYGQRKPTADEAASVGMTLEEAIAAQELGDIRFRLFNGQPAASLQQAWANTFAKLNLAGRWEGFQRQMLDEYFDLRKVQETIAKNVFGSIRNLPPQLNAWRKENLRHGAYQDQRARAERRFIEPISRVLGKADATQEEFSDYLWWRHVPERDAYLRGKLDPAIAGSVAADALAGGITPADATAAIANLDPAKRRAFERAAKFIDGMRANTLKTLLDSGQITQQHYDALVNQYQFYVPFRGDPNADKVGDIMAGGKPKGLSMSDNAVGKRAAGRKSKPTDILEHMVTDLDNSLVGVQKQGVLTSLVNLIATNPDPAIWTIQPVASERRWVDGVLKVVQTKGDSKDQITFMHNGIPLAIEIADPNLKKALLNLHEPVPKMLRTFGRITRYLSAVKTSLSPMFMLINPVRDAGFATMAVGSEHGIDALVDVAKFYPVAYAALARDTNLKVAPSSSAHMRKAQQYAREFGSAGGKTGYTHVRDIRDQQKTLARMLNKHKTAKGVDAKLRAKKAWGALSETVDLCNDLAENSTRLAVYSAMREKGMTIEDAAAYAKEVTVNFNRRGSLGKHMNAGYMFFNAAVQGSARMTKLTLGNKKFAATMGGLFAASYALALGQMLAAGDDDDGESLYEKDGGDMAARRSLMIRTGDGNSINIPVPYGPNMFTYMGYRLAKMHYNGMRGKDDPAGKVAGDIMAHMMSSMSPIDPGKGGTALLPEILRIPIHALFNKNDFGGKINPTIDDTDRTNPALYHETKADTAFLYRMTAQAMNAATGGDEYEGGKVNLTGEQLRYVAMQLAGGIGTLAMQSSEFIGDQLAGIDPEPGDVPLANVYFKGKPETDRTAGRYYENLEDFNKSVRIWKQAVEADDQPKMAELMRSAPWVNGAETDASTNEGKDAQAGSPMQTKRETDSAIRALRKERDAVFRDDSLNAAQKRIQARAIEEQIEAEQRAFNTSLNAGRGILRR